MTNGLLSRMLAHPDLCMIDAVRLQTNIPGPHTFIHGTRQIDGAWVTPDVNIHNACFLPFNFGVGDHRGIILDVSQRSILGGDIHKISRPTAQRLACNKPRVLEKYNDILETYSVKHNLQRKLYALFPPSFLPTFSTAAKMGCIDRVLGEGMAHAEIRYRKIRSREVPFSDKVATAGCRIKL